MTYLKLTDEMTTEGGGWELSGRYVNKVWRLEHM